MGGSVYRNVLESNIGKNGIGPVMRLKFLALPLTDPEASPCIVIENYRFIRFDFQFSIFWIIIISFRIFHFSFFLFFFFPNFRFFPIFIFPFSPTSNFPPSLFHSNSTAAPVILIIVPPSPSLSFLSSRLSTITPPPHLSTTIFTFTSLLETRQSLF